MTQESGLTYPLGMEGVFHKTYGFNVSVKEETEEEEGRKSFEGYASTFGNVDHGKDCMVKGCFKETLKERGPNMPILANHDSRQQIGWNIEAKEDKKGLFVKGEIDTENNAVGREKYSLMKRAAELGAKMGLSIGFRLKDWEIKDGVCMIKSVDLMEYSVVAFPMNEQAQVTSIKSHFDKENNSELQKINALILNVAQEYASLLKSELARRGNDYQS